MTLDEQVKALEEEKKVLDEELKALNVKQAQALKITQLKADILKLNSDIKTTKEEVDKVESEAI